MAYLCSSHRRVRKWEESNVADPTSYTFEDRNAAMTKLRAAAMRFDQSSAVNALCTRGFEEFLTNEQFKEQIRRTFEVSLTKEQVQ
jgi:hypothetical protein